MIKCLLDVQDQSAIIVSSVILIQSGKPFILKLECFYICVWHMYQVMKFVSKQFILLIEFIFNSLSWFYTSGILIPDSRWCEILSCLISPIFLKCCYQTISVGHPSTCLHRSQDLAEQFLKIKNLMKNLFIIRANYLADTAFFEFL